MTKYNVVGLLLLVWLRFPLLTLLAKVQALHGKVKTLAKTHSLLGLKNRATGKSKWNFGKERARKGTITNSMHNLCSSLWLNLNDTVERSESSPTEIWAVTQETDSGCSVSSMKLKTFWNNKKSLWRVEPKSSL